ncbi:hypothetical protein M422DRAFT_71951 [Sphaerobolus stellatus SS14]|uniref:Uncharacterized protein n=1 Tax=Sphaerobolus stellatus (strain SS14) TaxID=990650 RepID=A0A0C9TWL1_SPHS4|nr:hypothetical protein M422DRAFT_71951 [Sphaerobolus stellatus SS14]
MRTYKLTDGPSAFECDRQVAHDRAVAKEQSILINHRNNLTQRLAANGNRAANRAKKADKEIEVRTMLSALEAKMAVVAQQQKDVGEEMKPLRAQKKQASGGKKRNLKSSGRGQPTPAFKSIPSTSATKENDPFLTSMQASTSSFHHHPHPPSNTQYSFALHLPPELEPPPPSLHLPTCAQGLSAWHSNTNYSTYHGPYPLQPRNDLLPPSSCPPSFSHSGAGIEETDAAYTRRLG